MYIGKIGKTNFPICMRAIFFKSVLVNFSKVSSNFSKVYLLVLQGSGHSAKLRL
jgi:hypothetical protein